MRVASGKFIYDEGFIKIADISAIILEKECYSCEAYDEINKYFVVHLKNSKVVLPEYISGHFNNSVGDFMKYLGI